MGEIDKAPHPNEYPWYEREGEVQMRMAVWDDRIGWTTTRTSLVCRDHLPTTEMVALDARGMLAAIKHRMGEA